MIDNNRKQELMNDLQDMMDQILNNISFESDIDFVARNYTRDELEFFINEFSTYNLMFKKGEF